MSGAGAVGWPGVKLLFVCRRLPELDRSEYARRILEDHVPLAIRHHPTMQRYAVHVVEREPSGAPVCDSIAALGFDTLDDFLERLYDSPAGREIIGRDVERFMADADAYATRELVHRDERAMPGPGERSPGIKWICPLMRGQGLSRADFARRWQQDAVPRLLAGRLRPSRCVTNLVEQQLSKTGDAWDAFAELCFPDAAGPGDAAPAAALEEALAGAPDLVARHLAYGVAEYVQK